MWKRAQEADFLTINEKRALVRKPSVTDGDVIIVPAHMTTLENIVAEEPEEEPVKDPKKETEDNKTILKLESKKINVQS